MLDASKAVLLDPTLIKKRAAGMAVEEKSALLHVPLGTSRAATERVLASGTKQWVARLVKEGWQVESKAVAKVIPRADEHYRPKLDSKGGVTLWTPNYVGMRDDHPFLRPGHDAIRITAWFSRKPQPARIEIEDSRLQRLINKGKVPAGLQVA